MDALSSLQDPGKGALTHHPQAGGGTAYGRRALSDGASRMRIQLHGEAVGTSFFFCRANRKLPFFKSLMGVGSVHFHFAGQYSVCETNAQPAPVTGLFKGFRTLSQQAKTDFRRSRWKSVLSICGNKCTACKVGEAPVTEIEHWLILCYTSIVSVRQIKICKVERRFL